MPCLDTKKTGGKAKAFRNFMFIPERKACIIIGNENELNQETRKSTDCILNPIIGLKNRGFLNTKRERERKIQNPYRENNI